MPKVTVQQDTCKGCGLCVAACPKDVLQMARSSLNQKGYHPAEVARPENCIGCAFCFLMCPDCAIIVEKEDANHA